MAVDGLILKQTSERKSRRRNPPRFVRVLAACASLLVATSCLENPPSEWQGPADAPTVAIEGDSLVHQAHRGVGQSATGTALTDQLSAAGFRSAVAATTGAKTTDLAGRRGWPSPVDIQVIALGTNDGHINPENSEPAVDAAAYEANIRDRIHEVGAQCVVLVGVAEVPEWGLDQTGPAENSILEQIAVEAGGEYVDWNGIVAASEEPLLNPGDVHFAGGGPDSPGRLPIGVLYKVASKHVLQSLDLTNS